MTDGTTLEYIPIEDAMTELQVTRDTWRYWRTHLGFEHKKFPLDRRKYISVEDFERIKAALEAKQSSKRRVEHSVVDWVEVRRWFVATQKWPDGRAMTAEEIDEELDWWKRLEDMHPGRVHFDGKTLSFRLQPPITVMHDPSGKRYEEVRE